MKITSSFIFSLLIFYTSGTFAQPKYSEYVNPFIGTGGHGHTFPGAVMPFGMVQLSPDTRIDGSWDGCSGYHFSDSVIYGFSHTHLSGTGCSDYGDILLMPYTAIHKDHEAEDILSKQGYASTFSHSSEKASPGFYAVHLNKNDVDVELTVTERAGFHKYTFPKNKDASIVLDLRHRDQLLDDSIIVIDRYHVKGMRRSKAWAQNQVVYFYMAFSETISDAKKFPVDLSKYKAVEFEVNAAIGKTMYVKVGISQTSMDGARKNLEAEIPGWDFEKAKADAATAWNKELSKIEVNDANEEKKTVFYTALYHCMIHPSLASDVDGKYLGRDFKVHEPEAGKNYYTVFSLWDTYRALHPLLSIIDEKRTADFINTFLLEYQQGGRLPVWELSSNETDCMIGYHSVSVIADAAMKGIKFDYHLALEAMKHSAEINNAGLNAYREHGCISMFDEGESVSKTLEYSYDDWCISQMAKLVGDAAAYNEFIERAQYWKNMFDWNRGFMRAKKNGGWYSPFNPFEVNFNYTEANAWQYLFAVPQDIDGLIFMMGGKEKFEAKLDSLFSVSSKTEGREQSDISGLIGQYAQGNEPSHHMAYLYDYIGKPEKTQQRVLQIMNNFYHNAPDGLIGNEDCGQMSAWYVMSAIGFYEVTPGYPYYAIGSTLFDEVKIHLENGKSFAITTTNQSEKNNFISSTTLNGKPFANELLADSSIRNGGSMMVSFGDEKQSSGYEIDFLPSKEIQQHPIEINPVLAATGSTFTDTIYVTPSTFTVHDDVSIYPTDGIAFDMSLKKILLSNTTSFTAKSKSENGKFSKTVEVSFTKTNKKWKVSYNPIYHTQYNGGGDFGLIDEVSGSTNFKDGTWQGWWGNDMELIIDLGEIKPIKDVSAEFLSDQKSWIFFPKEIEVSYSLDGNSFISFPKNKIATPEKYFSQIDSSINIVLKTIMPEKTESRYIKIRAINLKVLPSWHFSAGGMPWIFCDEIFIE